MNSSDTFDLIIVGGGIAGLWTLAQLRKRGYNAILLEKDAIGCGQSMASQGIIHGGSKYALAGVISPATNNISQMPSVWQEALDGIGPVDLRGVNVLSDAQYLVPSAGIESRLLSFLGSKSMASFTESVKAKDLPEAYKSLGIKHTCFRLNEMVLDTDSLFSHFYDLLSPYIFRADVRSEHIHKTIDGIILNVPGERLYCRKLLLAAGMGNGILPAGPMQSRPLQMMMIESAELPPIYAHFIGRSNKPLLTITSHPKGEKTVWYMGGDLAENAVGLPENVFFEQAGNLLRKLLPDLNLADDLRVRSLNISRAEPMQSSLLRPDDAHVECQGDIISGWPTKLALAPRFADKVQDAIAFLPKGADPVVDINLDYAPIAHLPWNRA